MKVLNRDDGSVPSDPRVKSQKLITPFSQALAAVLGLLGIRRTGLFQPLDEEFFILLQDQELTKDNVSLVKSLLVKSLAKYFANACQFSYRLLSHGF